MCIRDSVVEMAFQKTVLWLATTLTVCFALLSPGDHVISIRATNDTIIHVPPSYDGSTPIPIVFALHGLGENYPGGFQSEVKFDAAADKHGFATVYPLGSVSTFGAGITGHTWNGGKCCFSHSDDLSFLLKVVNVTTGLLTADSKKFYAVGFSAGGVMSHTLGCQAADTFAAVVSVDGPIEVKTECKPTRPVPVLHFHGTLDPVFPYSGAIFNGAVQTISSWRATDECVGDPIQSNVATLVKASTSENCSASVVELVKVVGGMHAWPPARMAPEEFMWSFLSKWSL
eukprot:TRINITY_DN40681_c0_g1_i1.p1 TRINITY_DN40681_c0_g1~~TRINITY_DN40681_c0_g1_i1.p1  ORF type:complete len:286 (-),score=58.37 TRINITY_DN40681_c0_g1_i1:231-1088(-)